MRINKHLALSGVASRRKCDEFITAGRVSVNGKLAELGTQVEEGDDVRVNGKPVFAAERKVYLMLNKPCGYVSTVKDPQGRKTVMDLLPKTNVRLFPIGRLDYDTSGLLLFTNDGDFSQKLMHPSNEIKKTYTASLLGEVDEKALNALKNGVRLKEFTAKGAEIKVLSRTQKGSVVQITIHEGKNRQVRRMFEALGYEVVSLIRVAIGEVRLGSLPLGKTRTLTNEELSCLYKT